jgi:hypothetical protein
MKTAGYGVEIAADLVLEREDGVKIHVGARDKRLQVDLDPRLLRVSALSGLAPRKARTRFLGQVRDLLVATGTAMEFRVSDAVIARLGERHQGGFVSRLLGLGPMAIDWRRLLSALLQRSRRR